MWDCQNDKLLDARLRDVPVPTVLRGRLHGIAAWSDQELDWQLRQCRLPEGLNRRLALIVPDARLDDRLRDVVLPAAVVARARIIPHRRHRSVLGRLALAASLLVMFSLGYWGSLGAMLLAVRSQPQPLPALVVMDQGPLQLASPADSAVAIVDGPASEQPEALIPALTDAVPLMLLADRVSRGPAGQLFAEWGSLWVGAADEGVPRRWPVLGHFRPEVEMLQDLEIVSLPAPSGPPPPLTRALDREFLYSRRTQPPLLMFDADHLVAVPLSSETTSFDLWRQTMERGRLPAPEQIRAADFLAALDYRLTPAPPRTLALRTAGGPSVFNRGAAQLLQVAVVGPSPHPEPAPATHLTIALDVSASMSWNRRLDMARRGILRALSQLRPRDRFSLVVFREEPFLLVSEAPRDQLSGLYELLANLEAGGAANLGGALQQAMVAALDVYGDLPAARRLVLVTDSGASLTDQATRVLTAMLDDASERSFSFEILDVGGAATPDARLAILAQAGGGSLRQLRSASQIRRSLIEILHQSSPLVAEDVQLEVEFNPNAVAGYRLIGWDPRPMGVLCVDQRGAEVHVGDELTGLLEVWLHPNDEDDVAVAQLRWKDAEGGQQRSVSQRISRMQFASSFEGAALSLQKAAIVAELGEVLRQGFNFDVYPGGYRYDPKPRDLKHILQMARRANPQLAARPDLHQLLQLIQNADRNAVSRPPALSRAGTRGIIGGRWRESKD